MNSDLSMYRVREKEKSEWLCDENERENFTDKLLLLLLLLRMGASARPYIVVDIYGITQISSMN